MALTSLELQITPADRATRALFCAEHAARIAPATAFLHEIGIRASATLSNCRMQSRQVRDDPPSPRCKYRTPRPPVSQDDT